MVFDVILLIYLHLLIVTCSLENEDFLDEKLSDEERNHRCCAQHLDCCSSPNSSEPTNFEVRALLVKCPKPGICDQKQSNGSAQPQERQRKCANNGCKNAAPKGCPTPNEVTDCNRKLKLAVKVKNKGVTDCKHQYIVIDHVFDSLSNKKQKLANPYVLKIRQQPILQTFGLKSAGQVNYEAKEKVINKENESYTGCNTNPQTNPTCGSMKYNDQTIPFSTGFCCSCKSGEGSNATDNFGEQNLGSGVDVDISRPLRKASDNVPKMGRYNKGHDEFSDQGGAVKEDQAINPMGEYSRPFQKVIRRRLIPFSARQERRQKRGGQDCNDMYTPPNVNPGSYHDSTHCLEFSDLWYNIYQLSEPKIYHSLEIQVYEKQHDSEGNLKWRDMTKGNPIIVGTHHPHACNDMSTVTANYVSRMVSPHMFTLNYKVKKLLVPDITKDTDTTQCPLKGGANEYLVVDEDKVQPNGKTCDVAGVGYEAFAKQPHRCNVPKGSCLKNQPKDLWEHDHQAEADGKKGCYFLKYYGLLPENPILTNQNCSNKTLVMYYTQCYTNIVDVEFKADSNFVLRPNSQAVLTEVYVDSSNPKKTCLIAKVFNSGFVASVFLVKLTECPMKLPASFSNVVSKPALIPPQHQHKFSMEIHCSLSIPCFHCTMEVVNVQQELIAVRKIRFETLDRCICIWHCLCACLISDNGLKCKPLSLEHYHAAGFQGGLPIPLHVVHYTFLDDMISLMLYILLFLFLTLLVMGLIKAIVGIVIVAAGLWGLDMILNLPKMMNSYYESSIKHRKVVYDEDGWPVHPDTGMKVRNISLPAEFCINVVFFFIYPLAVFWCICKKLCFSSYQQDEPSDICICKHGKAVLVGSSTSKSQRSSKESIRRAKSDREKKSDRVGKSDKEIDTRSKGGRSDKGIDTRSKGGRSDREVDTRSKGGRSDKEVDTRSKGGRSDKENKSIKDGQTDNDSKFRVKQEKED